MGLAFKALALEAFFVKLVYTGARKFSVSVITRDDIFSLNRETERETSVPG